MTRSKTMKKAIVIVLTMLMIMTLSPTVVFADNNVASITVGSVTVTLDQSEEGMWFNGSNIVCTIGSGFYPKRFTIEINDRDDLASRPVLKDSNGDAIDGGFAWAYQFDANGDPVLDGNGNYVESTTSNYGMVTLPDGGTSTLTIVSGNTTTVLNCSAPNQGSAGSGDYTPYAYMPAAGQFANEGVGTGGWGDIYTTTSDPNTNIRLLKVNTTTGVSLGYFGGSLVLDFGANGVSNNPNNPFGVDFILYGNAFWNNSELGCVQVADAVLDEGSTTYRPGTWYTLAGSYYYTSNTTKSAEIEYTNPQTESASNSATTGTDVNFTTTPTGLTSDTYVKANNFHRHSFFPTIANYITGTSDRPSMAKESELAPIYTYTQETGSTNSKLKFKSTPIVNGVTSISTVAGTFGYADYYPVKDLGGHYSYNPYATSGLTDLTTYNALMANGAYDEDGDQVNASGGEPMDLSWAVDSNGTPVNLSNIRYVRVYTGVAKNNGVFGEISTEICGAAKATAVTNGVGYTGYASISAKYNNTAITLSNISKITNILKETTVNVPSGVDSVRITTTSSATKLLVKDTVASSGSYFDVARTGGSTQYFRIITQGTSTNAKAQASIIVLKVVFN